MLNAQRHQCEELLLSPLPRRSRFVQERAKQLRAELTEQKRLIRETITLVGDVRKPSNDNVF